ncbi:MAG: InlB B-repeat-containing protein, partial [Eubacteriales bacterium]|nr:InlB B-repeat-containing protein [Eubacteriales bacterium]
AVSVELKDVTFAESVAVKLYSGETLLTTATLQGVNPGSRDFLTCCIATETADEYWALTPWTPKDDVVPDKAVLVVDGHELNTKTFTLDTDEWAKLPGTVLPPSGTILRAYLNTDRITVDMANVTFYESVALELYSGDTPLTTSTLNAKLLPPPGRDELTGMIGLTATDEYWTYTAWTPKKDVVPDTVKLRVDGVVKDEAPLVVVFNGEETRTMTAEDWKALDATVLPPSGIIDRKAVKVHCINDSSGSDDHSYNILPGSFSIGDVILKDGVYTCDITVDPELYVAEYVKDFGKPHTLSPAGQTGTITLIYYAENQVWDLMPNDDLPIVFTVTCSDEDETFTVTYLDGFSGTYATYPNLKYGDATPVPANPYRSGYIFLGWEPSVAPTVTGDEKYVAQWGYIGPQYPNPTPVQPVQPGILPPQTGDMPLWYAIARFLGLVK